MATPSVEFVENLPASSGKGRGHRAPYLDELEANPGVWAKLPVQASALPTMRTRWSDKGFEFAVRDGEAYGRFMAVAS